MSHITNVLIQGAQHEHIDALNAWLQENDDRHQHFGFIETDFAGGAKVYCPKIWAAAFNYMPGGLREKLTDPETWKYSLLSVAIIIDGEDIVETILFDYVDVNKNSDKEAKITSQVWR